jgi:FdrA protein
VLYSIVKPNTYQDSLRLMQLSEALRDVAGVGEVSIVMGTEANKAILRAAGLGGDDVDRAGPTDLVIAAGTSTSSSRSRWRAPRRCWTPRRRSTRAAS